MSRADWLLERMVIGDEDERTLSSWLNCFLASASQDASDNALYSADFPMKTQPITTLTTLNRRHMASNL